MMRGRLLRAQDPERGAALVSVVGVMMIVGIVTVTLLSVTLFNTGFTAETRAEVRAQAAADAGVDVVLGELDGKNYMQLHQVCSPTTTVDGIAVTAATEYTLRSGGTTGCPTPSQGPDVLKLTVTSRAETSNPVGGDAVVRTVVAELSAVGPPTVLDKAIFGENAVEIRNNTSVHESEPLAVDGNVYSNGGGTCPAGGSVEGDLMVASGDITLDRCGVLGDLWAEGAVRMNTSDGVVEGNLFSASTADPAVRIQNSSNRVYGNVATNGSVEISSGTAGIVPGGPASNGSVMSVDGEIRLHNGARIGGSAYAHSRMFAQENTHVGRDIVVRNGNLDSTNPTVHVGDTVKISGTWTPGRFNVGSMVNSCQTAGCAADFPSPSAWDPVADLRPDVFGPSGQVIAPPRENLPQISSDSAALAMWEAEGWSVVTFSGSTACSEALDHIADSWSGGKLLVDIQGCSGPVSFNSADSRPSHQALVLQDDLAILSDTGFATSNMFEVSTVSGDGYDLFWIVPSDAPGVTWNPVVGHGNVKPFCSTARNIAVDRAEVSDVSWFLYSPCTITTGNNFGKAPYPITGQIYGGTVWFGGDGTVLHMPPPDAQGHRLAVPSLASSTPSPSSTVTMNLTSRYDVPSS